MTNALEELLNEKGTLLADGATGTNLFNMGLTSGDAPEMWNIHQPEKIHALHRGFIEAGSDIILTNSFGGTRHRLKLHKAEDQVHELNKRAAEIAREEADKADRKVVVAGSVGPTGELFEPMGALTHDIAVESFSEQMHGLKDGGADVIWIETMSSPEEIRAAAEAASRTDMPYVFTASFDTAGRTMMGMLPADIHQVVGGDNHPCAVGANCGVGASDLLSSVLDMTEADPNAIVVAKANCGVPVVKGDEVIYTGTPQLMYDYVQLAMDSGAKIIGGCCGNTFEHVASMRKAIDEYKTGSRPSVESIVEKLGPLVNQTASANAARPRRERKGRRRG